MRLSMESLVFVQHGLLAIVAIRTSPGIVSGAEEEHALQGICYRYSIPANTEFGENGSDALFGPPENRRRQVALFLRLLGRDAGSTRILLRVHYQDGPDRWREMQRHPISQVLDFPSEGEAVLDVAYNLPYLRIGGIGLHALTVYFQPTDVIDEDETDDLSVWQDEDEWATEPGWAHGATEYFEIVRET
jgi:hypothetical protein